MINRFRTRCLTCKHPNTLRITLGTDSRQEHTFACCGCGENIRVALDVNFEKRQRFEPMPEISFPTSEFHCIENCELCDEEGTITNLDPNFLVSEELLHQDQVFPWMYQAQRIGFINEPENIKGKVNDVIEGIGGQRNLRAILSCYVKARNLFDRDLDELGEKQLEEIGALIGHEISSIEHAAVIVSAIFLGQARQKEIQNIIQELRSCVEVNEMEYRRFKSWMYSEQISRDMMKRQIGILSDYLRTYDQFSQVWIYASRDVPIEEALLATSKDIRNVRMFYGNVFEELSAGMYLPACLNNIKNGRPFDEFLEMNLKGYLSINKAKRATPFEDNSGFQQLHEEFDSVIRNASHHAAIRVSAQSENWIEYRSGDNGGWKKMQYAEYLLKCNRIMFCLMRLHVAFIVVEQN